MPRRSVLVRVTLGVLLLAAAGLKLYGLGVSAVPRVGWFAQPWVQLAVAEWELVLGLWLLSGAYLAGSWLAAVATFGSFAAVSGYLGWVGVASCGRFGAIHASPWHAFAVDVAALALLAVSRPPWEGDSAREVRQHLRDGLKWAGGVAVVLIGLTAAATAVYGSPNVALAHLRGDALLVTEPYLDLGSGHPDEVLEGTVTIRNVSEQPIRLIGGTSDCSCTVVRDLPVAIQPGCTATVGVQLRIPVSGEGRLTRLVFLRTDISHQPTVRVPIACRIE